MADFDADDFDIDELLDEIDSGTKGKDAKPGAVSHEKKNPGGGGANKAVRFSEEKAEPAKAGDASATGADDDFMSKIPRSQRDPPSSSLRTMFFADNQSSSTAPSSAGPHGGRSSRPPLPPSASSRARSTAASGSSSDWLGIQDGKGGSHSGSPSNSPPPPTQRSKQHPVANRGSSAERNKSTGNSSEEEEALFQDIGLSRQSRRSTAKPLPTSASSEPKSLPPTQNPRTRTGPAGESNPTTPQEGSKPLSIAPPKAPFSSSFLDQLGMSPPLPNDSPKTSLDLSKPSFGPSTTMPKLSQLHQPLPSSESLLGGVGPTSSIPQESPGFPPMKSQNPDPFSSFSLTAPSVPQPPPEQHQNPSVATKKKVVKKDQSGLGNISVSSTLQLPSHLINEDELKAMSSSLKTLYANQLEMLEKSYKEQMIFINEANHRKEELLKEEMKSMQADYEERLDRLKNEIRELETKQPSLKASLQPQDLETLHTLSEKLNTTVHTLQDFLDRSANAASTVQIQDSVEKVVQKNLGKNQENMGMLEERICSSMKAVDESVSKRFSLMNDAWRNLLGQIKNNMNEVVETALRKNSETDGRIVADLEKQLFRLEGNITGTVDKLGKNVEENDDKNCGKILGKLSESEKLFLGELAKILKLQRKTKEQTEGIILEPIVKVLESDREDEQRRRERLALSVKEMRRDIKRLSVEGESRQESLQKFNMSAEMELKSISQSIRDLNSQLKFSVISGPDNMTNQFNASMQQTQTEMEMKLLRDERQALSDSMAQVNVEKRKISEERVELEKQKLDFQREKDKLNNLEMQLKTKIGETEEMQKKTESVRREELQLSSEAHVKLKELEKEKAVLREKLLEAEQRLRAWEQKLRQEKSELVREREFLDKLRDQLLCPGCMKHNDAIGVIHPPPPPYLPNDPGTGALLNQSSQSVSFADEYFNSRINAISGSGGGGDANELFDVYYRRFFD